MPCQCHIKIHHSIQALDVTQNIRPSLSKLIGYYTGALVVGDNQTLGIGGDSWLPLIFRDLSAFIGRSHASQMPESAQHVTVLTLLLYPQHQFLAVKVYQPVRQKTSNPVTSSVTSLSTLLSAIRRETLCFLLLSSSHPAGHSAITLALV